MRYDRLRAAIEEKKGPIVGPRRWAKLYLNEKTGAIFPVANWNFRRAEEEKTTYTEHNAPLYFTPGDICVVNYVPLSTFELVPYGIPSRFIARKSPKSEYVYVHDFFDQYEAEAGMEVSMIDGTPLKMRKLDDIEIDQEKLLVFKQRLKELKCAHLALQRMSPTVIRIGKGEWQNRTERRQFLAKLLSAPLDQQKQWGEKLATFNDPFLRMTGRMSKHAFDNMIRFDKAALFRALEIVV